MMGSISRILDLKGDNPLLISSRHLGHVVEGGGIYRDHEYLITCVSHTFRRCYICVGGRQKDIFDAEKNVSKEPAFYCPELKSHHPVNYYGENFIAKTMFPEVFEKNTLYETWIGFNSVGCLGICDVDSIKKYFKTEKDFDSFNKFINQKGTYLTPKYTESYEFMENECRSIIDQLHEI